MENKEKAREILEDAVEKVHAAINAIDSFAEANGLQQKEQHTIHLTELIDVVAEEMDICSRCTAKALYCAFNYLRENKLYLIMDVEEEEEDEDDE